MGTERVDEAAARLAEVKEVKAKVHEADMKLHEANRLDALHSTVAKAAGELAKVDAAATGARR